MDAPRSATPDLGEERETRAGGRGSTENETHAEAAQGM